MEGATRTSRVRGVLSWVALGIVVAVPIGAAAASSLLAWRDPIYIAAGFAGVVAMALMLVQPLLVGGYLPGFPAQRGRRVHRVIGGTLVAAVVIHVGALWITSPPDVVDVLLFRSPTPFSVWGAIAMWAVFAAALLAIFRRRMRLRAGTWRLGHTVFVAVTVLCSIVHALLVEGTMETVSKAALCTLVIVVFMKAVVDLKVWAVRLRRRS